MKKSAYLLVLIALMPDAAFAQMDMPIIATPPYNPGLDLLASSTSVPDSDEDGASDSYNSQNNVAAQPTSLTYTPSKSRTRTNLQSFVNKSRAADPAGAEKMEQLFASTDIIGAIGAGMASVGLSKNNAADAYAVYWINAWEASRGTLSQTSPDKARAVARQAARGLSQSQEFARATDAQKQEMAEVLMIQAAMIESAIENAAGDADQLNAVSRAVTEGAKASGLNLDEMTLTDEGFVQSKGRKGADASGASGEGDTALASAENDNSLSYGIMAALGLGAAFMIGKGMRKV